MLLLEYIPAHHQQQLGNGCVGKRFDPDGKRANGRLKGKRKLTKKYHVVKPELDQKLRSGKKVKVRDYTQWTQCSKARRIK